MITPYLLAKRYQGIVVERQGAIHHPAIQFWLELCKFGRNAADETPWCSAFVNFIAWQLDLPRTDSARARSWLDVGQPVNYEAAMVGFDIVVLERDGGGHVGFFDARQPARVFLLGGNQSNAVTIQGYPRERVLGVRRLA